MGPFCNITADIHKIIFCATAPSAIFGRFTPSPLFGGSAPNDYSSQNLWFLSQTNKVGNLPNVQEYYLETPPHCFPFISPQHYFSLFIQLDL